MASPTKIENERAAVENVEALLLKLATQLPALVDELCSVSSMLKQTNISSSLSTATCDVPPDIAAELRLAAEAADSKQFFTCTQKLKTTSSMLQMLMDEAKRTRRKLDNLAVLNTTALEHQLLQRQCLYLEQAVSLLYALLLGLNEAQLTANALYVHGLRQDTQPLQEADDLKDAIARLVSIVSTKHIKSTLTSS